METAVISFRGHSNTAAEVCSKPESEKTDPCYCPPGTCEIVYLRTHPKTGEKYAGQAKSSIRYFARQREHNRAFRATQYYIRDMDKSKLTSTGKLRSFRR